ncbi:MAG: class I SAM-dependent methyltransferase [Candidatus Micrarchaeaceae archaeon]
MKNIRKDILKYSTQGNKMAKSCKICKGELVLALDLGKMPSANKLVAKKDLNKVKSYPLTYHICKKCSLFQLTRFVGDKELFLDYPYMTGASKMLVEHFKEMSNDLVKISKHKKLAYVMASNDGTEINLLKEAGFKEVYGVEPSNIGNNKPNTINNFFNYKLSQYLVKTIGKADLITANNVFAHIPNPNDMLKGMANLIKDDGIISIEVHALKSIIEQTEVESLYAEHFFVWSIKAMYTLTNQLGLKIAYVIFLPQQHGGSYRLIIKKTGTYGKSISRLMQEEEAVIATIGTLQKKADERKVKFAKLIKDLKVQGKSIGIWGVPAKVPTLLNFCGITEKEITCAYEVAPTKIGKWIPKANIEIKDEKMIAIDKPDFLICGAWNYWDFALKVLDGYIKRGGKLINPLTCKIAGE